LAHNAHVLFESQRPRRKNSPAVMELAAAPVTAFWNSQAPATSVRF
jgi:hypothetical protein